MPKAAAKGKVVLVSNAEPTNFDAVMEGYGLAATAFGYDSIVEQVLARNAKTSELIGSLAEKWEQKSPDTWRYTLRKGVKLHNGEDFNADAIVYSLNRAADKGLASKSQLFWPGGGSVTKVDDFTVDVKSAATDPIQHLRMVYLPVVAPKWAQTNPEELPINAIGTGPYKFVEWVRVQYVKMTANDNYWGKQATIKDVTLVWRAESAVRAAMIKTGEADWAYDLSPEDAKQVPKTASRASTGTFDARYDTENPVLKDKRVRQAMNMAIDVETLMKTLVAGISDPAKGHIVGDFVLGFNPNIKPYAYDQAKAKSMVAEAKAAGIPTDTTELDLWGAKGRIPRLDELMESMADSWGKIGLKIKMNVTETAKWREAFYAVQPGKKRGAVFVYGHYNDLGDSAQSADSYVKCGGILSTYCDKKLDETIVKAANSVGEERVKLYQQVWAETHEQALFLPMFVIKPIFGLSKRLNWEPRVDKLVMAQEMSLTE